MTVVLLNDSTGERTIKAPVESLCDVRDPDFMQSKGNLLVAPILPNNRGDTLRHGDGVLSSMMQATHP